jgi:hypothetical protein
MQDSRWLDPMMAPMLPLPEQVKVPAAIPNLNRKAGDRQSKLHRGALRRGLEDRSLHANSDIDSFSLVR